METATSVLKNLCGGSYLFQVDSVYFLLIKLDLYRINQLVRKFLMTARKIRQLGKLVHFLGQSNPLETNKFPWTRKYKSYSCFTFSKLVIFVS